MITMYLNCDECRLLYHERDMENESICIKCANKKEEQTCK